MSIAERQAERIPQRDRGGSHAKPIDAAKERIPTIDLADLLCGPGSMRKMGARWGARCPLPGHDERTPSFTVFPEQNSWYCFGACQRGGDVVDLAAAAWGYGEGEMAAAAANLLHEFGQPIPERPASWHRKQARQQPVRDELDRIRTDSLCRRLFRIFKDEPSELHKQLRSEFKPPRPDELTQKVKAIASRTPNLEFGSGNFKKEGQSRRFVELTLKNGVNREKPEKGGAYWNPSR